MTSHTYSVDVPADAVMVFDIIHDYQHRLDWDSMLSQACLLGGATAAAEGVASRCVGGWRVAYAAVESRYVTFKPGHVAAVVMTSGPWFFESFAASIRHQDLDEAHSRVTYCYQVKAKPYWLRFFIEPLVCLMMSLEVRWRLAALSRFIRATHRSE